MVYYAALVILTMNVHFIDCGLIIVIHKSVYCFDPDLIKTMPIE